MRRLRQFTPDYCFGSSIQIIHRKRYRAIMKVSVRSLMYDVEPVHDDVAGQDFQATVQER
ncbi:hypothetical protein AYJ54_25625 [Bradyrhizobium centrolobii]|uniref:Uncharacterized protein n=1 Tax=Bradyrhizobium centrolobii TaxID=1505087 RepID=A0A176YFI8_9BRAD|nr:hypothetical protein AYJ54_25625 [Bradyrhizobium centrolobii]